jgi:hypothetical protein
MNTKKTFNSALDSGSFVSFVDNSFYLCLSVLVCGFIHCFPRDIDTTPFVT